MTTLQEQTKHQMEVMDAYCRGEKIEFRPNIAPECEFKLCATPNWDWSSWEYRIAPKPKKTIELYQWLCEDGDGYYIHRHVSYTPFNTIRRLDETKMIVEVEDV